MFVVASVKDEFGRGAVDEVWIPGVASQHGVALTQDLNIHRVRAQWELCKANKIGIFFFKPPRKEGMELLGNRPIGDAALAGNQETCSQPLTTLRLCSRA